MIDTLGYIGQLMKAGLNEEQAEIIVRGQLAMISNNVATKADLAEIRNEIKDVRHDLKDFRIDIKDVELNLTKRLGGLLIFLFGLMTAFLAYLSTLLPSL